MEAIKIDLEIIINKPAGIALENLTDQLTDYIYKYYRNDVDIQTVRVVKINDKEIS